MSFIGRLRVLGCLAGLRDDACQIVEALGASFGVELLARRWSRRRGRFEKGQGQLHGNSPHWPLALGAESSGGSGERRRSPLRGANRPVRGEKGGGGGVKSRKERENSTSPVRHVMSCV